MAYWNQLRGLQPPIPIRQFNGVLKPYDEGFSQDERYFIDAKNITSDKYPAFSTRQGFSMLGTSFANPILGLGVWKDDELHAVVNGQWYKWDGSTWNSLLSGLNTTDDWSFTNFKGNLGDINLIAANGQDPIKRYDGSTVQNLTDAPSGGNYITQHDNRLYCAVGNSVKFSALSKADDWTTNKDAGEVIVETTDGELINGLIGGSKHLTIFKPNNVYELFGTGPSNYRRIPSSTAIGCVGNKSVVNLDGKTYFVDRNKGIVVYDGGLEPDNQFSLPVKRYIEGANRTYLHKITSGTDGTKLYVAIPYGSATENSHILEYDPRFGTWYVWEGFTPTHFSRMNDDWFIGDESGNVMQMGGTDDNGTAISWHAVSKPFGSGRLAARTNWYNIWIVADVPTGSTLKAYLSGSPEGDDWTLVKEIAADVSIQSTRIIIPVATVANKNFVRLKLEGTGPVTVYEIDRQVREMPMR